MILYKTKGTNAQYVFFLLPQVRCLGVLRYLRTFASWWDPLLVAPSTQKPWLSSPGSLSGSWQDITSLHCSF